MEAILEKCCGLDVHKREVVACLLVGKTDEKPKKEVRRFSTMTAQLKQLRKWLVVRGCTHVAMESTGPYWKPIFNILEGSLTVLLANAHHIKNVPGRKTDTKDCEWIAELLRCGLIRGSFIPPRPIRELRDLTRYRRKLVDEGTRERNRVQKILEDTNLKIGSVLTDVFGVSGQKMLEAIIEGKGTPEQIAELARGRLRSKISQLTEALEGVANEHHRFILKAMLEHLSHLENQIAELDERIVKQLKPFGAQVENLQTIPGIKAIAAAAIVAEIGNDMGQFPTEHHLASWAGMCPGNNESAGKKSPPDLDPATSGFGPP